jgi:4-hydroxy-tetrahydrodipicolinate synthase
MNPRTSGSLTSQFHGIFAALVTPMTDREEIDVPRLEELTDRLIRRGVHGLIPLGSTGEYYALGAEERERVLKTVVDTAEGRVPIVAGTNGGSTREIIAYSRQAEKLGAQGVMLAPPYYSLPTLDELRAHFKAVSDAIGIPIMLYNYPGRTGVDMPPDFIEKLATLRNVRYVKESTGEMPRITQLLRRCGDQLGVFCGCDTIALESLLMGAVGWVGGVVNALPASHVKVYELAVEKKNHAAARAMFFDMLPALELMEGGGKYTQWAKAACALTWRDCGPPRRPLLPAATREVAELRLALRHCAEGRSRP